MCLYMTEQDNIADWLPMSEVIARTGLSQRTIYRKVIEGQLRQANRTVPGRRPLPVFDPGSISEMTASGPKPTVKQQQEKGLAETPLPPSELSFKLYLTEEEAIRYTGFGRAHLRTHGKGRPIGPNGARVYRRVDLEKL
jgi:hypothetical protein